MEIKILEIGETDLIRDLPTELKELDSMRKTNSMLKVLVVILSVVIVGGTIYILIKRHNQLKDKTK